MKNTMHHPITPSIAHQAIKEYDTAHSPRLRIMNRSVRKCKLIFFNND